MSVCVWTRVTSGEPAFAPAPIEAQIPAVREDWHQRWDRAWQILRHTSDPRAYYAHFRAELGACAEALAAATDAAGHAHLKIASTKPRSIRRHHLRPGAGYPPPAIIAADK